MSAPASAPVLEAPDRATRNVRDATFDVLRRFGSTTIFSNPGSTEISLLTGLPGDLRFVLALHEASVVGMATGHALATGEPALVVLHTTAGLGNAVGALATARTNGAPLVVVVGQQDRRHLALQPFLAGELLDLAGEYPVWVEQPALAKDVPGAVARAHHEAVTGRGPALVVVPMDDWEQPAGDEELAAAQQVLRGGEASAESVEVLAQLLETSQAPLLVVGARNDSRAGWDAAVALAEAWGADVVQEAFGARAGFPQDHPRFVGHLPSERGQLRTVLERYDVALALGAPVFRQYPYSGGTLLPRGLRVAVVSDDPAEVHRSPAELSLLAEPASTARALTRRLASSPAATARSASSASVSGGAGADAEPTGEPTWQAPVRPPRSPSEVLRPSEVMQALAARLAPETVVVEETPSSRPLLHRLLPARRPMGFLSAAMGGLGFAVPAAVGVRMALPDRPVVAVVGDGSSLYAVQALWSAAHYGVGTLFVVLANGRYAIMDRLARDHGGGAAPWPAFAEVSVSGLARSLGCEAERIDDLAALEARLDALVPGLGTMSAPLVLEVVVDSEGEDR